MLVVPRRPLAVLWRGVVVVTVVSARWCWYSAFEVEVVIEVVVTVEVAVGGGRGRSGGSGQRISCGPSWPDQLNHHELVSFGTLT